MARPEDNGDPYNKASAASLGVDSEPEEGNGRRAMDPELLVMSRCLRIIEDLPPAGQRRVLIWLCDRCHGNGIREALANGVGA